MISFDKCIYSSLRQHFHHPLAYQGWWGEICHWRSLESPVCSDKNHLTYFFLLPLIFVLWYLQAIYPGYRPKQGRLSVCACNQGRSHPLPALGSPLPTLRCSAGRTPPWLLGTTYLLPAMRGDLSGLELHVNEII